jgi:coenzyme F420-reducing hydrogenase alpha subunit
LFFVSCEHHWQQQQQQQRRRVGVGIREAPHGRLHHPARLRRDLGSRHFSQWGL